jgi:hypothetical protein
MAAYRATDKKDRDTLQGQRIRIEVSIPFLRAGRRDSHNYVSTVVKTIVDALITEGMAPDDTPEYVQVIEPHLVVRKTLDVVVLLTPIGPTQGEPDVKTNQLIS